MILKLANWKLKKRIKKSSQGSDNSWFSSWSGLSTTFYSPESKKKEFSNDDEEEDNGGGLLVARKETKAKAKAFFFFQARTSSQATNTPTQTCVYKDDNKDNNQDDDDDSKVEFFLKVGQHKKIKFFKFLFRKKLIIMQKISKLETIFQDIIQKKPKKILIYWKKLYKKGIFDLSGNF